MGVEEEARRGLCPSVVAPSGLSCGLYLLEDCTLATVDEQVLVYVVLMGLLALLYLQFIGFVHQVDVFLFLLLLTAETE